MTAPLVIEGQRPTWIAECNGSRSCRRARWIRRQDCANDVGAASLSAADAAVGADARSVGTAAGIWWLLTVVASGLLAAGLSPVRRVATSTTIRSSTAYSRGRWDTHSSLPARDRGRQHDGGLGGGLGAAAAERGRAERDSADTARVAQAAANVGKGAAWDADLAGAWHRGVDLRRQHETRPQRTTRTSFGRVRQSCRCRWRVAGSG